MNMILNIFLRIGSNNDNFSPNELMERLPLIIGVLIFGFLVGFSFAFGHAIFKKYKSIDTFREVGESKDVAVSNNLDIEKKERDDENYRKAQEDIKKREEELLKSLSDPLTIEEVKETETIEEVKETETIEEVKETEKQIADKAAAAKLQKEKEIELKRKYNDEILNRAENKPKVIEFRANIKRLEDTIIICKTEKEKEYFSSLIDKEIDKFIAFAKSKGCIEAE